MFLTLLIAASKCLAAFSLTLSCDNNMNALCPENVVSCECRGGVGSLFWRARAESNPNPNVNVFRAGYSTGEDGNVFTENTESGFFSVVFSQLETSNFSSQLNITLRETVTVFCSDNIQVTMIQLQVAGKL